MQEFIRHTGKSIDGVSATFGQLEHRKSNALSLMESRVNELHEPVESNSQHVSQIYRNTTKSVHTAMQKPQ